MGESQQLGRPGIIQSVERVLYTTKSLRNIGLVVLSLYVAGSHLLGTYSIANILVFLRDDPGIALFAVLLGVVLTIENAARLTLYSRSQPDDPRIAAGIVLSFTALGFGLALIRIWLATILDVILSLL